MRQGKAVRRKFQARAGKFTHVRQKSNDEKKKKNFRAVNRGTENDATKEKTLPGRGLGIRASRKGSKMGAMKKRKSQDERHKVVYERGSVLFHGEEERTTFKKKGFQSQLPGLRKTRHRPRTHSNRKPKNGTLSTHQLGILQKTRSKTKEQHQRQSFVASLKSPATDRVLRATESSRRDKGDQS